MGRRIGGIVRGLGALAVLLVLVLGPPTGLAAFVGWPLPESIPTLDAITEGARSGVPDAVLINTLAILGWLAWAQLALTFLVEAVALLRNVSAPSLPVLPGVQFGVGRLLATAALLLGGLASRSAPAPLTDVVVPAAAEPVTLVVDSEPAPAPTVLARGTPTAATESGGARLPTYTVQRHDSWWGVAEDVLGDGTRWRELRDLNVGASMDDGQVITETTDAMNEGWTIRVPAAEHPVIPEARPSVTADVVVERGDNLWDISEEHLEAAIAREASDAEVAPYWQEVISANQPGLGDPNLIHPGQVIHLPGRGGPQTADESAPPVSDLPHQADQPETSIEPPTTSSPSASSTTSEPQTVPPTSTPAAAGTAEDRPVTQPDDRHEADQDEDAAGHTLGLLGAAGTLLAAGLAAALTRRRRRRELWLPPAAIPPDPPHDLDELRADIVRQADLDLVDVLAYATSTVADELAKHRSSARLRIVQASQERIDMLLSEPVDPAPDGWKTEASGSTWVLQALNFPEIADESRASTHPLLVSLGRPDADGQLYLDLEAEGLLNVDGDADDVAGFVRSTIHELSVSPIAGTATVFLVGDCPGSPTSELDRVHRFESWDRLADTVLAWAHQTRDLLSAHRWPTPAVGRADGDQVDDLAPMVIVLDHEPDDERFVALCSTISEAIVPVVVLGVGTKIDGATDIAVADGRLSIQRLNLICDTQAISAETGEQAAELLHDAERIPAQLELIEELGDQATREQPQSVEPYLDPPFDILVRVLGEIEVLGAEHSLTPMQTSVFVYLALHSPVASDTIQDAIWTTPTENRKKRLANTISEIRPSIGPEHLPAASDGKYRVGPRVKTDLELLEARITDAAGQPPELAMETLRGALDLVAGPVFTYRNSERTSYVWVDHENWISSAELKVTSTAERLALLYLNSGDHEGAGWAASVGLKAAPTHTRLTDLLMRAHHAAGNRRAIDQVFSSHVNALQQLDIDDVDPDLANTYESLRNGRRSAAG